MATYCILNQDLSNAKNYALQAVANDNNRGIFDARALCLQGVLVNNENDLITAEDMGSVLALSLLIKKHQEDLTAQISQHESPDQIPEENKNDVIATANLLKNEINKLQKIAREGNNPVALGEWLKFAKQDKVDGQFNLILSKQQELTMLIEFLQGEADFDVDVDEDVRQANYNQQMAETLSEQLIDFPPEEQYQLFNMSAALGNTNALSEILGAWEFIFGNEENDRKVVYELENHKHHSSYSPTGYTDQIDKEKIGLKLGLLQKAIEVSSNDTGYLPAYYQKLTASYKDLLNVFKDNHDINLLIEATKYLQLFGDKAPRECKQDLYALVSKNLNPEVVLQAAILLNQEDLSEPSQDVVAIKNKFIEFYIAGKYGAIEKSRETSKPLLIKLVGKEGEEHIFEQMQLTVSQVKHTLKKLEPESIHTFKLAPEEKSASAIRILPSGVLHNVMSFFAHSDYKSTKEKAQEKKSQKIETTEETEEKKRLDK
jgi:hypothetical protein